MSRVVARIFGSASVALLLAFAMACAFAPTRAWSDGGDRQLQPGTYTVSANLSLSAGDADKAGFPVLKSVAGSNGRAYMTNPANPLGAEGGSNGVPTSPVSDNATLEVADDGSMLLTVPVANPVFTMQVLGTCDELGTIGYTTKSGKYGKFSSRIDSISAYLPSASSTEYELSDCAFHPTIMADKYPKPIRVPMTLDVDLSGVPEVRDEEDGGGGNDGNSGSGSSDASGNSGSSSSGASASNGSGSGKSGAGDSSPSGSGSSGNASGGSTSGSSGSASSSAASISGALKAGTYRVTANLSMLTPIGIVAYATNPDNPLGLGSGATGIPNAPMSKNAVLTVGKDGSYRVRLDLANPVFTVQKLGNGSGATLVGSKTTALEYGNDAAYRKEVNAAGYTTRINEAVYSIPKPSGSWKLTGCKQYATALRSSKEYSYGKLSIDMTLEVDSSSAAVISAEESKSVGASTGLKSSATTDSAAVAAALAQAQAGGSAAGSSGASAAGSSGKTATAGSRAASAGSETTSSGGSSGKLAAGTYTVSANIWVNKATSGLPLQPHFTSAAFPPMNPVENNATLTVGQDGKSKVEVPIVIQSRVMLVKKISGLKIVDSASSEGGLSSITVDLGELSSSEAAVTEECTASVELGSPASTIIGGEKERTWQATFQVNFKGVPESGGGEIPEAARALMDGAGSDGRAADVEAAAASAADSALAALDNPKSNVKISEITPKTGSATSSPAGVFADVAGTSVPLGAVIAVVAIAAAAAAGYFFFRRFRISITRK